MIPEDVIKRVHEVEHHEIVYADGGSLMLSELKE